MHQVEIFHGAPMSWARITVDDVVLAEDQNVANLRCSLPTLPARVKAEFQPYGIRPRVRFNEFLLDTWLANIQVQDHMLEFHVDRDLYSSYHHRDMAGRMAYVTRDDVHADHAQDKFVGINNLYPDLVREIKELLR